MMFFKAVRAAYARDHDLTNPLLSPLFGDFTGFPPTLIQMGEVEMLRDDSVRLKQALHIYYYRRDRNRVISFKRASGLISRLGQLRKCNSQRILKRYYQPKTMFDLKKVVRRECRRLQKLYPPYKAA